MGQDRALYRKTGGDSEMRTGIWLYIVIFICMWSLPLVIAADYFREKKGKILKIRKDYIKDARYFGHSFAKLMEKALPYMKDHTIILSKPEKVREVEGNEIFEKNEIEELIVSRKAPFSPGQDGLSFQKEIYSETDVIFGVEDTRLRAVYSKKRVLLGKNTRLLRWADAEKAVVTYDGCDLGRSVSSGEQLVIGYDTLFHRLYAPIIRLGQKPEEEDCFLKGRDAGIFRMTAKRDIVYNVRYAGDDLVTEDGIIPYTIISKSNVSVIDNFILQGDLHSDRSVRIMENAVVIGNIFAEKEILLEKNATVLGNMFTQGDIVFEEGAGVGRPEKISSVIARDHITFYGKNYVFGYIDSESGCRIMKAEGESFTSYCFPKVPLHEETITFRDLEEYQNTDKEMFRKNPYIKKAVIPKGAEVIPKSYFFGCENLKNVKLPISITVIEDYAFADCRTVKLGMNIGALPLKRIGTSAFENCEGIELNSLPDSLETVEGAAFSGCNSIKKVVLSEGAALKKIGDHAFSGCRNLESVFLPDGVEYVGVSAFSGCESLKRISVPEGIKEQPGIKELREICPTAEISFREVKAIEEA